MLRLRVTRPCKQRNCVSSVTKYLHILPGCTACFFGMSLTFEGYSCRLLTEFTYAKVEFMGLDAEEVALAIKFVSLDTESVILEAQLIVFNGHPLCELFCILARRIKDASDQLTTSVDSVQCPSSILSLRSKRLSPLNDSRSVCSARRASRSSMLEKKFICPLTPLKSSHAAVVVDKCTRSSCRTSFKITVSSLDFRLLVD